MRAGPLVARLPAHTTLVGAGDQRRQVMEA